MERNKMRKRRRRRGRSGKQRGCGGAYKYHGGYTVWTNGRLVCLHSISDRGNVLFFFFGEFFFPFFISSSSSYVIILYSASHSIEPYRSAFGAIRSKKTDRFSEEITT